jgi:hypothetical protein
MTVTFNNIRHVEKIAEAASNIQGNHVLSEGVATRN